ncbi:hypothetical protein [Pedobacter insulae]|uniref:Uncharacterized protein n=1 Tax=Pedobacter insulae TaxID=414048 RepID=A0A1I3A306_9SPHI|nr:hypothetical protein [Pedobacter insulae]SFH44129.1 hypothetical protein SAMN04489864_112110 [Pedobacter insulae]
MVEGKYLDHPELEEGDRSRMKIFRVNPHIDLPINKIECVLQKAIDLCRMDIIQAV